MGVQNVFFQKEQKEKLYGNKVIIKNNQIKSDFYLVVLSIYCIKYNTKYNI